MKCGGMERVLGKLSRSRGNITTGRLHVCQTQWNRQSTAEVERASNGQTCRPSAALPTLDALTVSTPAVPASQVSRQYRTAVSTATR